MILALIDNGSLAPAAHQQLRAVAAALSERTGETAHAVSWKHSDRIASEKLSAPVWTLARFVREHVARGEREFVFVPFFISAQGAIGSALRADLESLQRELGGFEFTFTEGLAAGGVLVEILASRIREALASKSPSLTPTPVILVDHGGPSAASAELRDSVAEQLRRELGSDVGPLVAASMEGEYGPLLADQLRALNFSGQEVLIALLFLSPGRHAGPGGDVARICHEAGARCTFTALVGSHPLAIDALAAALRTTLSQVHALSFA